MERLNPHSHTCLDQPRHSCNACDWTVRELANEKLVLKEPQKKSMGFLKRIFTVLAVMAACCAPMVSQSAPKSVLFEVFYKHVISEADRAKIRSKTGVVLVEEYDRDINYMDVVTVGSESEYKPAVKALHHSHKVAYVFRITKE